MSRRSNRLILPTIGDKLPRIDAPILQKIGARYLKLGGWQLEGQSPNIPKAIVIYAPHTSTADVFVGIAVFWTLQIRLSWLAKDSLFFEPLGSVMRWSGAIPIERQKRGGVVEQMVSRFADRPQMILAMAPEGTRSAVAHWKSGFYHIAQQAGVPIICVAADFGRKTIIFRDPFSPTGDKEADMRDIREWYRPVQAKYPDKFLP